MKTTNPKATKTVSPIICQIVNTVPAQFIAETAKAHKVLSRTFSPKSHVAAMLYCQVSKTESLNSICDVALANETLWTSMGVSVPRRNTFANANATRPSATAKDLYWKMYNHLIAIAPKFGTGPHKGYCFRIKAPMFAVDSSTIKLTMNSFDWARHRRQKAAAKLHMTLDLGNRPCQIHDFIGYSENAVQWQVWIGLLAHLILRYLRYLSMWGLSFSRLAALIRGTLWNRRKLIETLRLYGTAGPVKTPDRKPKPLYFQAILDFTPAAMGQQVR